MRMRIPPHSARQDSLWLCTCQVLEGMDAPAARPETQRRLWTWAAVLCPALISMAIHLTLAASASPFLLSDAHFHRLSFLPYLQLMRDSRIHQAEAQNNWPRGALTLTLFVGGISPWPPMGYAKIALRTLTPGLGHKPTEKRVERLLVIPYRVSLGFSLLTQ